MKARRKSERGFLYDRVAGTLQRRIADGVYPPGAAIPSEADLVRAFRVSAITVRRAIRDLTFQGALFGRQGRGVFVADRRRIVRVLTAAPRTSIGDEIRRAGFEPGITELSSEPVEDREAARELRLPARTRLWRHEKVILADGQPVSIEIVHLPHDLGERLRLELGKHFVFPLLTGHGIPVARTDFRFEAGAVSEAYAAVLGLPLRAPLIVVHYTLYGRGGAGVLTGRTIARSDRFTFALSLPATAVGRRTPRGPRAGDPR